MFAVCGLLSNRIDGENICERSVWICTFFKAFLLSDRKLKLQHTDAKFDLYGLWPSCVDVMAENLFPFFLGRILVYVYKVLWLFVYFNMYVNSLQFSSNTVNIAQRTGNNLLLVHSHTVCGYTIIVFYGKNIRHKKLDLHSYRLVCSSVSEFWLFMMSDVIYSML